MGVERFFSSFKSRFSNIFKNKINCNHLLIDFNSIVHVLSQYLLKIMQNVTKEDFESRLIKEVGIFIETILSSYISSNILKSLSICVDGVPTMAKIYEQKKRRYMGDLLSNLSASSNENKGTIWSRNNISPGTDFMFDMVAFLKSDKFKFSVKKICPAIEKITVSGVDEIGEGEFKIIKIIEKIPPNDSIVVYSPDSDMIILLFLVDRSIVMLRYDQQESTYELPSYNVIEIDKFKNIFTEYIENKSVILQNQRLNEANIIVDMVFILSVFGDDFLPKLETVRVNTDLNILIDFYIVCVYRYGYILTKKGNKYTVETDTFLKYLKLIEEKEDYFIERNAKHHMIYRYNKIEQSLLGDTLYKLRDLMINYIWKFIYLNKPKDITINPINVLKHIPIEKFIKYIDNKEIDVDYKLLNSFSKLNINRMGWTNIFESMLRLISFNFIEIIQNIDGEILNRSINKTNYIECDKTELLKLLLQVVYSTYELPFSIPIQLTNDTVQYNHFNSTKAPYAKNLARMAPRDKTMYMIEHKLDKYYSIFNPVDPFYKMVYKNLEYQGGNNIPIDYNKYYSMHFHTSIDKITKDYIMGLNWIVNYYHNHIIDTTWYYPHNRSPMLHDIIKHFNKTLFNTDIKEKQLILTPLTLTPLEHFVFVSPFHISDSSQIDMRQACYERTNNTTESCIHSPTHSMNFDIISRYNKDKINKIINFIKDNKKYYYDLDSIYKKLSTEKIVDCSGSHFISKCHLLFMENYISITDFIIDIRKYLK
jgi:5'-3' exonuclease